MYTYLVKDIRICKGQISFCKEELSFGKNYFLESITKNIKLPTEPNKSLQKTTKACHKVH
jgi:hypothetical protein